MIIEMTQDGDGVWMYHDNTQAEICLTVMALTGWEITGFDDWINTDSHWADTEFQGKENRNELIQLRHRLTKTFHDYNGDNYVIQLEAERLYAVAQWIAAHIAGYKVARKVQKHGEVQSDRRTGKTKLTESEKKQVVREYEAAPVTYGMVKSLARKFDVSDDTISRIVNVKPIQSETNQD